MKGILQSLEAVISILMVLAFFVIFFISKEPYPEFETVNWKVRGFNSLKALDESNRLREFALTNNSLRINESLQGLLPTYIDFDIRICDKTCVNPNISAERIVAVSYFIAGNESGLNPREIVLYMW